MTPNHAKSEPTTTVAHHPSCPYEYAWDVAGEWEVNAACTCPTFYPRRVCTLCWQPPKRHLKTCPRKPKKEAR